MKIPGFLKQSKSRQHRRRHGIKCGYAECEVRRGRGSWEGVSESPPYQLGGLGSAVSSPAGSAAEPWKILNLVHFGT